MKTIDEVIKMAMKDGFTERTAIKIAHEVCDNHISYMAVTDSIFEVADEKFWSV